MFKKLILIGIVFFSPLNFLVAGVVINEIMYNLETGSDEGREWIEIYNDSDTSVNMSDFKFFEADTNHKLVPIEDNITIPAKGYALIISDFSRFNNDWPNFGGIIFDSSFSLNNNGEALALKNGDLIVDEYTYNSNSGGAGDGKSLQEINGKWLGSKPTPGAENKISYTSSSLSQKTSKLNLNYLNESINETDETSETKNLPVTSLSESGINKSNDYTLVSVIILILLLGMGIGAVYFVRQKKIVSKIGDDFDLID